MATMSGEDWGKAVTHFEDELLEVARDLAAAEADAAQSNLQARNGDAAAIEALPGLEAKVGALLDRRRFLAELVVEARHCLVDAIAQEAA